MTLVYTPHAEGHVLSAIRWYNEQQARLGERFQSAVRKRAGRSPRQAQAAGRLTMCLLGVHALPILDACST